MVFVKQVHLLEKTKETLHFPVSLEEFLSCIIRFIYQPFYPGNGLYVMETTNRICFPLLIEQIILAMLLSSSNSNKKRRYLMLPTLQANFIIF